MYNTVISLKAKDLAQVGEDVLHSVFPPSKKHRLFLVRQLIPHSYLHQQPQARQAG